MLIQSRENITVMIRGELHKMENSSRVISFMDEIKEKIRTMQKEVSLCEHLT